MNFRCLFLLFNAIILSRVLYALPAWGGFVTKSEMNRINPMLKRCYKFGYTHVLFTFEDLLSKPDSQLFNKITRSSHLLNFLLPLPKPDTYILRPRGHNYPLPIITFDLSRSSFVIHCLFNHI